MDWKVLGLSLKGNIDFFFLQLTKKDLNIYFYRCIYFFIKYIHPTLTGNKDANSLTSSMFLCHENPAVNFQAPECCPNGHHLIKWSLQVCQWSICCRPFRFGSLQRSRTRYRIKCTIFCCESLGFVHWSEKFYCAESRTVSSGPLHWRTVCCSILLPVLATVLGWKESASSSFKGGKNTTSPTTEFWGSSQRHYRHI